MELRRGANASEVEAAAPSTSSNRKLKEGIANFYDESSNVWEVIWGEHMHHGYYGKGEGDGSVVSQGGVGPASMSLQEHKEAQVLMIDKVSVATNQNSHCCG